jgi:hypothetical protein
MQEQCESHEGGQSRSQKQDVKEALFVSTQVVAPSCAESRSVRLHKNAEIQLCCNRGMKDIYEGTVVDIDKE